MINLDDVEDATRELERPARLGLSGAMITEYSAEDRRYDQPEYGPGTLRDASSRATKAFYPALSMCDMIFSGVFERHPLTLVIVVFELAWAPHLLSTMG